MKKAWIENNKVRDICNGNPAECFHPDIAIFYDTNIDDNIIAGAELINEVWVNPIIVIPDPVIPPTDIELHNAPILIKISELEQKSLSTMIEIYSPNPSVSQPAAIQLKSYYDEITALRSQLL